VVRLHSLLTLSFSLYLNTHSYRDINTHQATIIDVLKNAFCASGMHLPSGSCVTFRGNDAVGPGATSARYSALEAETVPTTPPTKIMTVRKRFAS